MAIVDLFLKRFVSAAPVVFLFILFGFFTPQAFSAAAPGTDAAWSEVLAAARTEGTVSVIGLPGVDLKRALTEAFQRKYPDIRLEFVGMPVTQVTPKIALESRAKRNTTDIAVVGSTTALLGLLPGNAIAPIRPLLNGPSTRNLSEWRNGRLHFSDEAEQYHLVMSFYRKAPVLYNPNLATGDEFTSYWDLVKPKWKGKMGMRTPTRAGGGLSNTVFWYSTEGLGKEFIRELFTKQDLTFFEDNRQQLDFLAHGKHSLTIGASDTITVEAIHKGLPIRFIDPARFKEGTYLTAGGGGLVVIKDAPHPNAARVYLDWLLSREAQTAWSKASGHVSARRDVPTDHLPKETVPEEGVDYQENHRERYLMIRDEVVDFVKSVLRR